MKSGQGKIAALVTELKSSEQLNTILKGRIQALEFAQNQKQFDQYFPPNNITSSSPPPPTLFFI